MKLSVLFTYAILAAGAMALAVPAHAVVALPEGGGGRGGPPRPSPMAPPGWVYRWVAPVYQNVMDQVWIADRTQMVQEWVEITPGHLQQVWQQVLIPGHWQATTRRVLIADGHYELVQINPFPQPPVVIVPAPPVIVRNAGTVGVEGYNSNSTEDMSKFSPLNDWPDKK
ncbi:MAG TPA: hypothetical protein VGN88_08565 [Phycisphaerae bacterium]